MVKVCQCNNISDTAVKDYIEKNAEQLEALPSNKATARIFNSLRQKTTSASHNPCANCLQPCLPRIEEMLIEAEAERCKGYQTPSGCAAADIIASYLFEMK